MDTIRILFGMLLLTVSRIPLSHVSDADTLVPMIDSQCES